MRFSLAALTLASTAAAFVMPTPPERARTTTAPQLPLHPNLMHMKRGNGTGTSGGKVPQSSGTSILKATKTIAPGESFDGGMVAFDNGITCDFEEGGDPVFELQEGASLSNVIIGPNQIDGVHCQGSCTLNNVWWPEVCEDAFTIKEQAEGATTTVNGGGAFGAEDKVLQHNGGGTMRVTGFTSSDFGKLYRSCGNCDEQVARHVIMEDITASNGYELAAINPNLGDTATLRNIKASGVDKICASYQGTSDNSEDPEETSDGPSDACKYSEGDVTSS